MIAQIFRFGIVGVLATLVHMGLGITMLTAGVPLHAANGLAFCAALIVGFIGHYTFSFSGNSSPAGQSFVRYLMVSLTGYTLNECIVLVTTETGLLTPKLALLGATAVAAAFSFLLSRIWAFNQI